MQLRGAAAIVTGGASGLGAASARQLARAGARVIVLDLHEGSAAGGADIEYVCGDVADEGDAQRVVRRAAEAGPLRALINCAGIGDPARTVPRDGVPLELARFERVIRTNLIGTFNVLRLTAAAMADSEPMEDGERGAIVNTASVAAFDGQIGQASYAASKGAIAAMTLPVARDLGAVGVRVNTIAPGIIDTPIYGEGPRAEQAKQALAAHAAFPRRPGTADEFARLAIELITNPYINAEVVRLDAGARLPAR